MVGFYIKKLISFLLEPYTIALILMFVSIMLLFFRRGYRCARCFVLIAFLLCYFLSSGWVANALLKPLERQYPPLTVFSSDVDTVVVLSGGIHQLILNDGGYELSNASFQRTLYGISLFKRLISNHSGALLILSGGNPYNSQVTESKYMHQMAKDFGVLPSNMRQESQSYDTSQQAKNVRNIVKKQSFYLVTSAVHMPRSMALFKKQRLNAIAAPCDFHSEKLNFWGMIKPDLDHFRDSEAALHEYLGLLWARLHRLA